jgi:hypothetical protein
MQKARKNTTKLGTVTVIQAEYRADAVLAHCAVTYKSDVFFSADSDLAVLPILLFCVL